MFDVLVANLPYLLRAAVPTFWLAFSGVGLGTLLGVGLGIVSAVAPLPVRGLIGLYVFTVRGVPVLVWMFLTYYALPALGVKVGDFVAVIGALVFYTGAFVTEIVRGSIRSVPRGQIDAARSLGMRWPMTLREVVLPQALKLSIPPLLGNSVMMIKASAYVSVVGVWELTYAAREVVERTLAPFQIFLGVMMIYFCICYPLSILSGRLERRTSYRH